MIGARLLLAIALVLGLPDAARAQDDGAAAAREAIAEAMTLPPGNKRDLVLRAVSRNLRWFGFPEQGLAAARAMSDGGLDEVPADNVVRQPRFVPLKDAMPSGNPCDAGLWQEERGRVAKTPKARAAWANRCLLTRDFHWIGLPERAEVRAAAEALPPGDTKAQLLAMLIRSYGDAATLGYVAGEVERIGAALPAEARAGLTTMLGEPAILHRLGREPEALAAALKATEFGDKARYIQLLVQEGDIDPAMAVFETLGATPPEFAETCDGWFDRFGGLDLQLGYVREPVAGVGAFLDRLPASPTFRKACPTGFDAETIVDLLLHAGRLDAAIARARLVKDAPFLRVRTLMDAAEARLARGEHDTARANAIEAAAALPTFDPGDPVVAKPMPAATDGTTAGVTVTDMDAPGPPQNFGEPDGLIGRRIELARLLAATGAWSEADALARRQPAGALRAVALSAAVAGRAGIRYGFDAPSIDLIGRSEM